MSIVCLQCTEKVSAPFLAVLGLISHGLISISKNWRLSITEFRMNEVIHVPTSHMTRAEWGKGVNTLYKTMWRQLFLFGVICSIWRQSFIWRRFISTTKKWSLKEVIILRDKQCGLTGFHGSLERQTNRCTTAFHKLRLRRNCINHIYISYVNMYKSYTALA